MGSISISLSSCSDDGKGKFKHGKKAQQIDRQGNFKLQRKDVLGKNQLGGICLRDSDDSSVLYKDHNKKHKKGYNSQDVSSESDSDDSEISEELKEKKKK